MTMNHQASIVVTICLISTLIFAGESTEACDGDQINENPEPEYSESAGIVPASVDEVWELFTTAKGLSSFYAREAIIDPKVGGLFELHVFPENPPGRRGIEGHQVLAIEPKHRLVLSWIVPAAIRSKIGPQTTIQEITLVPIGLNETRVRLRQFGFGESSGWSGAKEYFELRSRDVVFNIKERVENGTLDWERAMNRFYETTRRIDELGVLQSKHQ